MLIKAGVIGKRFELGRLMDYFSLRGTVVEIGVNRGYLMRQIALNRNCVKYFGVDPWISGYDDIDPASGSNREKDYQAACKVANEFPEVCTLLKMTSEEASHKFTSNSLDLVYIDGNHQAPFVKQDLELWWPKLKKGGIMAGHDIVCPPPNRDCSAAIQEVVFNFCDKHGLTLFLLTEPDNLEPWSFYVLKP